jgi:hypothetical protein
MTGIELTLGVIAFFVGVSLTIFKFSSNKNSSINIVNNTGDTTNNTKK